jgi:hypothetical protein
MPTALDKLKIIQNACVATGNDPPQNEDDGSPEWEAGSRGYERGIELLTERHPWAFSKLVEQITATTPVPSPEWLYAFARPATALHVSAIKTATGVRVNEYELIGSLICTDDPGPLYATYYARASDESDLTAGFVEALTLYVEGALLAAFEDFAEADKRRLRAEQTLSDMRARSDQEKPKRLGFVSRLLDRRRGGIGRFVQ